jgi:FAD synthase
LRNEQRFPSAEELIVQMRKDVQEVDAILAEDSR